MRGAANPIQIVGRSCRLPGAASVGQFWANLVARRCSIQAIGEDRWPIARFLDLRPGQPGKSYTFAAGTIERVWDFDPTVFGISPREALQLDPQQRLALQLVWEALEDALIPASQLARRNVGVYAGASGLDYSTTRMFDAASADAYFMIGNTLSLISNRVSHAFDLRGPSLTIDTACSSSLVALHHAVEALAAGRVEMAIVLGVNLLLSPFPFIGFAQASMLSAEGLCRSFDAKASGYVRAEGGVALILRRPGKAFVHTPRNYGHILATGTNSDGRTVGVSLPSTEGQVRLLEEVYGRAGMAPESLAFVEAHGTGTPVGDPIEAQALGQVLGRRRARPLPIGSVKSNIGHLEPASGLAGMLKAMLALEHHLLPATLHVEEPNPDIAFAELNLAIAREPLLLERSGGARAAAVSNFGFGGTNAHVVIADPSPIGATGAKARSAKPRSAVAQPPPGLFVLSAASEGATRALAQAHLQQLQAGAVDLAQLAAALGHFRDLMPERAVLVATTAEDLSRALNRLAEGAHDRRVVRGRAIARAAKVAFVFSGNGAQWAGMGKAAFAANASFRAKLEDIDAAFTRRADWSLIEALEASDLAQRLTSTSVAQPLLFAIQVATSAALAAGGLEPDTVLGHSVGEVAAAQVAGALSLAAAVEVILARSRHQEAARGCGAMAALRLGQEAAGESIAKSRIADLEIAAINSPRSVTVVGTQAAISAYAAFASAHGVGCKALDLDYPFHSRLLAPAAGPLAAALKTLRAKPCRKPFISAVTGALLPGPALAAGYWWRNVRDPVQFAAAVAAARQAGAQLFIEIGPRPILQGYLNECFEVGHAAASIASLEVADSAEHDPISKTLAVAISRGAGVMAERAFGPRPANPPTLPPYQWQYVTFRPQPTVEALGGLATLEAHHPLLGWRGVAQDPCWHVHIDADNLPWLKDHRVNGQLVFPGAGFAEMALAAARQWLGEAGVEIRDMSLVQPLVLRAGESSEARILLSPDSATLEIASRPRLSDQAFTTHAFCRFAKLPSRSAPALETPSQETEVLSAEAIYQAAKTFGLDYGPAFRRLAHAERVGRAHVRMTLLSPSADELPTFAFGLHPADLDAAFHGLFALVAADRGAAEEVPLVPVRLGRLRLYASGGRVARAELRVRRLTQRSAQADIWLFDAADLCMAQLEDVRFAAMRLVPEPKLANLAYHEVWAAMPTAGAASPAVRDLLEDCVGPVWRAQAEAAPSDEPRLLLQAAACRIAHDALAQHLGPGGAVVLDLEADDSGASSGLLHRLLPILEANGLAEETAAGWWRQACDLPPAADLLRTVLAEYPAWSADCVLLSRAAAVIEGRLTAQPAAEELYAPATLDHFRAASPRFAATRHLTEVVVALLERRRGARRPARLCVIGLQDGLARQLVDAIPAETYRLIITDDDKRQLERARLRYATHFAVEVVDLAAAIGEDSKQAPYDLIISAFGLSRVQSGRDCLADLAGSLAPDGALLAAEATPDAFHDLVFGIDATDRSLAAEFPLGMLRTGSEWTRDLARAGFADPKAFALGRDGASGSFLLAAAAALRARSLPSEADAEGQRAALPARFELIPTSGKTEAAFAQRLARALASLGGSLAPSQGHGANGSTPGNGNGHDRCGYPGHAPPHGLKEVSLAPAREPAKHTMVWIAHAVAESNPQESAILAQRIAALARLLTAQDTVDLRLWIVAPGGARAAADLGSAAPGQAGLWAAARTAANEFANADIRLIDLEEGLDEAVAARAVAALLADPPQDRELIVSACGPLALRLRRGTNPSSGQGLGSAPGQTGKGECAVLAQQCQGSLETLAWRRQPLSPPKPDEIVIEVAATGLNFRDVMWSLGLLPEEALEAGFAGPTLGFECSGIVRAVGSSVTHLKPGCPVVALAPQAFASHVTVAAQAVLPLPAAVDTGAAASIPVAFLTAYYALNHLARLRQGEWLLIHGGAGGVGLAALQIARWRGARVIATAGTQEKRALLQLLGAEHVLSSRSLEFVDQVRAITGAGVDIVLNSLSGEAMERSLELLRPFGRFLELGKRDFYANSKVGLRAFRHNVAYFAIDADQLLSQQPALAMGLMGELMQHFADGTFTALAQRAFDGSEVVDAFRLMQQSGHIGKILVRPPLPASLPAPRCATRLAASAQGAHVIIGGLGGFGLATAEWLADRGARALVLVGRSEERSEAARRSIAALQLRGIEVRTLRCDAADAAALAQLLDQLRAEMPIKGIVHAAMLLDDALLRNLDAERIGRVLRAKIDIGRHLDSLTRADRLDYFWLYSSITTAIGNPGQAAYVAGNAALEALARRRRAAGLTALAVRFGAIEDVGVLARERDQAAALARRAGATGLKARDALNLLERVIAGDDGSAVRAVVTLGAMNWGEARSQLPLLRTPSFQDLRSVDDAAPVAGVDLVGAIHGLDDASARELVARHLAGELSAILRMPADDLNWQRPLAELGLDSLMAVELRFAATRRLGIELPLSAMVDGASIGSLADTVLARLRTAPAGSQVGLAADQELADKHLDVPLNAERFEQISRQVGERAQRNGRVLS
ncbi:MAG: SDR family NAD(P)-dependent oxidoreductase [Hyphomicrobiaceae bacterium]